MVQFIFRLGGVPIGSEKVDDSTRHVFAGSIPPPFFIPNVGGDENERRNVSMLSTRRFATKLRGRAGSTCTRCALVIGEPCDAGESERTVLSDSVEPGGVDNK